MFFSSWLRKRNAKPRTSRRTNSTFRPRLEVLEGRDVPSTLTVTNLNDSGYGSLRDEIAQAQSNDTIVFDSNLFHSVVVTYGKNHKPVTTTVTRPQTLMLTTGELVINKSLTITGPGPWLLAITSQPWVNSAFVSENGSRIFEVDGASTSVAISGLTMSGGGGTRVGGGFSDNPYDGYGGAVLNFGALTLSDCRLTGSTLGGVNAVPNYAQFGGAVANFGSMTVASCDVSGNSAYGATPEGGGIYNAGAASALTVLNSIFSSNTPDNIFGAYIDGGGNTFN
jgi:hypothetical protein